MKKILTFTALAVGLLASYGQGTLKVYNISATYAISTNTGTSIFAGGTQTGGTSGKLALPATGNLYYFALLAAPYSPSTTTTNPSTFAGLSGSFVAVAGISNSTVAGGISGPGGNAGSAVTGWAAPTDANYNTAAEMNYILVGWSANLGATWASIATQLAGGWGGNGYFGVSSLGYGYSGGGPNSLPTPSIWSVTTAEPGGLTTGFSLYAVAPAGVPEPSTLALAALGGASLLLFRRRK